MALRTAEKLLKVCQCCSFPFSCCIHYYIYVHFFYDHFLSFSINLLEWSHNVHTIVIFSFLLQKLAIMTIFTNLVVVRDAGPLLQLSQLGPDTGVLLSLKLGSLK